MRTRSPRNAFQQSERCAKALADAAIERDFPAVALDSVTAMTPRHRPGLPSGDAICEGPGMPGPPSSFRPRPSAAIVLTRPDPLPASGFEPPAPAPRERDWQWVWWIPLGLLVAGAWALLLFGDSLGPPPPV